MHRISLNDIQDTARLIGPYVRETPLVRSAYLSGITGAGIYLKLENQQVLANFKSRGAFSVLLRMSPKTSPMVITASAGNHGQAIALAASRLGFDATVVVPKNTPNVKKDKIKEYGAKLVVHGADYDAAEVYARSLARKGGLTFVSPYNDKQVIMGQGTVAPEIMRDLPDVDTIIVPVGGGGLMAGVCVAARSLSRSTKIIGVQSETSPAMYEYWRTGKFVITPVGETIAEGISGNIEEGSVTLGYVNLVHRMVRVKEDNIRRAIRALYFRDGQIVEGAGAVPVAALMEDPQLVPRGKKAALVITGGNIEPELLAEIIR